MTAPAKTAKDVIQVKAQDIQYAREGANLPVDRWTDARIDAVIRMCAPQNTSLPEAVAFLSVAARYDLDPAMKEIWLVKDKKSGRIMVMAERDAFLKVAERHPSYQGIRSGVVCDKDEFSMSIEEDGEVRVSHKIPGVKRGDIVGAYAVVYMKGRPPTPVIREWSDYSHLHFKDNWQNYGADMIETRVITAALRRAVRITGIYAPQEFTNGELDDELPEKQRTGGLADFRRRLDQQRQENGDDPEPDEPPSDPKPDAVHEADGPDPDTEYDDEPPMDQARSFDDPTIEDAQYTMLEEEADDPETEDERDGTEEARQRLNGLVGVLMESTGVLDIREMASVELAAKMVEDEGADAADLVARAERLEEIVAKMTQDESEADDGE